MKLFAPQNNWEMLSPNSWWPFIGSLQTSSGVSITEESALSLTAFSCGIRAISETIAGLPFNLLEQIDNRTTKKAIEHKLYAIVHDQPNQEQDSMLFMDSQIALQVGWGNCYAEVERRAGDVFALWPIHPSRIPLSNISRNGNRWEEIYAGEPGEIVYYVNNDDGSQTAIAASNMLHVAGVLSRNGITGRSVVHLGKNALGIAQATEDHAGAFFRNGANPNIAIKSPKIVGKETADRLRQQWQTVFGGVRNHYKTILLEDGMEAQAFTLSPEASQLVLSRQYSVTEVARLLRIPPYFLMDLTQGKYNNLEAQGNDLVVYSLMPWIVRWEKALFRQLLTPEEKKKYRFKFNVMGLLRGDQAARAQFYQAGFGMGVFSPNDIREYEDLNPVEGGDQRFVPANNLVPLTQIGEMAQAQIEKTKAETERAARPDPVQPQAPQTDETKAQLTAFRAEMLVILEKHHENSLKPRDLTDLAGRLEQMPSGFVSQLQPQLDALRDTLTEMDHNSGEDRRQIAGALSVLPAKFEAVVAPVADAAGKMAQVASELPEHIAKAVETVAEPLLDAQKQGFSEQKERIEAVSQSVDATREEVKAIAGIPSPAPIPVDTSAAEAVRVREVDVDRREQELMARLTAERAASHAMLEDAIKIRLEQLAEWESKALAKAVDKPKEFKMWRERFYPRFVKQFAAKFAEIEPFAAQIGVKLDLDASADQFALSSINDLKTLDEFASDNWHDRLREGVDVMRKSLWTNRPQTMAMEMVERGKARFEGANHVE